MSSRNCQTHNLITVFCLYSITATQVDLAINSLKLFDYDKTLNLEKIQNICLKNIKQMEMNAAYIWLEWLKPSTKFSECQSS